MSQVSQVSQSPRGGASIVAARRPSSSRGRGLSRRGSAPREGASSPSRDRWLMDERVTGGALSSRASSTSSRIIIVPPDGVVRRSRRLGRAGVRSCADVMCVPTHLPSPGVAPPPTSDEASCETVATAMPIAVAPFGRGGFGGVCVPACACTSRHAPACTCACTGMHVTLECPAHQTSSALAADRQPARGRGRVGAGMRAHAWAHACVLPFYSKMCMLARATA